METNKELRYNNLQHDLPNSSINEKESRSCVICVGSMGTGKTSTVQKCTQQEDMVSGFGMVRSDDRCRMYRCKQEKVDDVDCLHSDFLGRFLWKSVQELIWVDTVGWNDKDKDGNLNYLKSLLCNQWISLKCEQMFS